MFWCIHSRGKRRNTLNNIGKANQKLNLFLHCPQNKQLFVFVKLTTNLFADLSQVIGRETKRKTPNKKRKEKFLRLFDIILRFH
mmetsp:Transcript_12932/g.19892  ORF Transcript_12932/g.19892 Transcript_12932/m.19892 type:complete len:84 (-) Transcript_12932:76-327(-)